MTVKMRTQLGFGQSAKRPAISGMLAKCFTRQGPYLMKRNRLLVETKVPVIKVMSRQSRKGRAMNFINLSTAALSAVLVLGLSTAPKGAVQENDGESQPVDQVEVMKVTGAVQKVDPDKRMMTIKLDTGKGKTLKVDRRRGAPGLGRMSRAVHACPTADACRRQV